MSDLKLRDLGDVKVTADDALATQNAITAMLAPVIRSGAIPLILGGDHSITSAVVAAFRDGQELGVLWFDSHPDLMDTFGAVRGREESLWSHACPLRRICELPNVHPENVLLVGVRDWIPEEFHFIQARQIEVLYARELSRLSPTQLAERIGQKFGKLPQLYVSFDIDILDPAFAPGTGVPIPGGISTRYLYDVILEMCERERAAIAERGRHFARIAGFDVVEIAPPLDVGRITSLAGLGIISSMLGYLVLQLSHKGR